jgi:hypothetical protein
VVTAIEQTIEQAAVNTDPVLFGMSPNNVYAVKTREGAIALVEIVEESRLGPTRLRYKLVKSETKEPST